MERSVALIDFVNVDSMVQVHGNSFAPSVPPTNPLTPYKQITRVFAQRVTMPTPRRPLAKF